ncbi:hypothetical protein [Megasphaera elsdenii]
MTRFFIDFWDDWDEAIEEVEALLDREDIRYDVDSGGRYMIEDDDAGTVADLLDDAGIRYEII